MSQSNDQADGMSVPVGEEAVSCTIVTKGPSLEELKAAIMRFVSPYMWEHEAFVLKRHEDAPCPWIERSQQQDATTGSILWAQFRHEGSIEDEWFTVFLLSYLTDRFKGEVIAQVWSSDGQFMLIEAAELLPKWVDSSQHGSLDSISRNRVWIRQGTLHLIPLHSNKENMDFSCKGLTFNVAAQAVFDATVATLAPARIQEHLYQKQLCLYPAAVRKQQQRTRVLLPRVTACVMLKRPKLAAAAARAFLNRSAKDMQSAMQKKECWMDTKCSAVSSGNKQQPQMDTCTVLLRRSHYAGLVATTFAAPKGYVLPAPGTPSRKAAMLGLKLSLGLQIYADRVHAELGGGRTEGGGSERGCMADSHAGQQFLSALEKQGYFRDSIEGSQEYQRLYGLAVEAWNASNSCRDTQLATQLQSEELEAARCSGITDAELRESSHMAEDSDKWMEDEFQMRLDEYRTQVEDPTSSEAGHQGPPDEAAGVGQSEGGNGAAEAGNGDAIEAEDLLGRLSRFMEGSSGLSGAKPEPSSFSLDVNSLMALLKPPGDINDSCREGVDEDAFSDENCLAEGSDSEDSEDVADNVVDEAAQTTQNNSSNSAVGVLDEPETAGCNEERSSHANGVDARCELRVGDKHGTGAKRGEGASGHKGVEPQRLGESFMEEYMHHLDEELKENASEKLKGVDVDMSCVADLLKSVEEGGGQPGAADGLIGMLGMRLPKASS